MSKAYNEYLEKHTSAVKQGYKWLIRHGLIKEQSAEQINVHDMSKWSPAEYKAYDNYFYGDHEKSRAAFDQAWLHHIHENRHHWQHWVLLNDTDGNYPLEMPYRYIIEMFCDHWAFSWVKEDLNEIFSWYEENKSHMILHPNTRKAYEDLLSAVKKELELSIQEIYK